MERGEGEQPTHHGFLPPEPPGPEPDVEQQPAPPPPPPPPAWQQQGYGWQPPTQSGWSAPYPYAPAPSEPDNGPAVAGFVLSMVGGGLLLFSFGMSSIVSVVCAALGIGYSRKGRRRVDAGETRKNRGLAQAGFIVGIVALVLSVIATVAWVLVLIAGLTDDDFFDDLERELEDSESVSAAVVALRLASLVVGLASRLLLG